MAALWCVWDDDHDSAAITVLLIAGALLRTIAAGLNLDRPARPLFLMRAICLWGGLLVLLFGLAGQYGWAEFCDQLSWDVLALAAEYAATIRTLPPHRQAETRRRWAPA